MPLKPQEREDGEHSVTSGLLVAVVPQVTVRLFLSIGTTAVRHLEDAVTTGNKGTTSNTASSLLAGQR